MKPVFQWVYTPQQTPQDAPGPERARNGAISDRIEQAFDAASSTTGTSFDYLVKTAQRESAMNPTAKASTSSATGLFQFIESTWLETMKLSGHEFGLGDIADKITIDSSGKYRVPDAEDRKDILALRNDPEISSMMAGALTRRNGAYLAGRLGRPATSGELYIAHFLGAAGAANLIGLAAARPDAAAADHFPRQAAANRPIFYERGQPATVAAVYADLVSKHGGGDGSQPLTPMLTAFAAPAAPVASDARKGEPAHRVDAGWTAMDATDAFTGLFRTDRVGGPTVAAASFWRTYSVAPAMFDVAIAEDEKILAAAALVQPPSPRPSPSLIPRGMRGGGLGPLDLSRFLAIDES
ncbi:MAG TPA: transglycosylase SLT domain-containing protein [Methylomirabilota bacterium]|nr:transglycosylase SLT domain-containing protein [Methylomirabilota bacterium]